MSVSQKDIAARAGVSCATVSRIMNDPEKVRPQLAKKVYQAMQEMGFELDGTILRQGQQERNVLVLVSDLSYSLFSRFLAGISQACNRLHLNMVVCSSGHSLETEKEAVLNASRCGYLGIIFITAEDTQPYRDMIRQIQLPVVFLNRKIEGMDRDSVLLSHFETAQAAVRFLLHRGHHRIAMLSVDQESTNTRAEKAGFIDSLLHSGIITYPQAEANIFYHPNTFEGGREFARRFVEEGMGFDALYTISSEQTLGLLNGFQILQGKMPPQLMLLVLNSNPLLHTYLPRMIVMEQPVLEMGRKAVEVLMERATQPQRERMNIIYNVTWEQNT